MYANINGTRIFFDVEGAGFVPDGPLLREKPVCFVLHGGPGGDHTIYKPALSPISEYMQLVYIDNRGSGLSDRGPQSTYSLENNVEDLEALRQFLGLKQIVLLGQSYGGMVALSYAVKYPDNLKALLLVTTSPSFRFLEGAKRIVEESGTPEQKAVCDILWNGAFESFEQLKRFYELMGPFYSNTYNPNPSEEERQKAVNAQMRQQRSFEALNEGFGGFLKKYDVVDKLAAIPVPTLIIGAIHDWITPVEESYVIADNIPSSELVIFQNSSHSVLKDEYDHFHTVVQGFVKRRLLV
ncbi:alpha/beta fold hydrolase [Paenibacillus solisilvae]|uniref:Alpha/beta fold hydrolase n=1 Tax=Paenibacillus solisilvae TaxID=2486751 RepID=A0ABW0VWT7_9BACL